MGKWTRVMSMERGLLFCHGKGNYVIGKRTIVLSWETVNCWILTSLRACICARRVEFSSLSCWLEAFISAVLPVKLRFSRDTVWFSYKTNRTTFIQFDTNVTINGSKHVICLAWAWTGQKPQILLLSNSYLSVCDVLTCCDEIAWKVAVLSTYIPV